MVRRGGTKLDEKVAIVTGSSKGIGKAIAEHLARNGYYVFITYHTDRVAGLATVEALLSQGYKCELQSLDVRSEASVRDLFSIIADRSGHLNVLVNNAVKEIAKSIEDATFEEWKIVTTTKIDGTFLCSKYAIPLLKLGENANIINITSFDGEKPQPDYLGYCVGTAGIIAITKALAVSLPKQGIRVNAVCPGATRTPLWDNLGGSDEALWEKFARDNPMGRITTTEDVANAVSMIIEDPGRYLNGNFIYVNGGNHLK
jgi:NAD(P)-dependent dehydrogenase (short-subunit alcohol dehydrogenase family)